MITDKSFNYLVDQVYEVDKNKNSTPWKAGDELRKDSQSFRVLSAKDNTANGMQAMAVAPIDKATGKVDYSQVVIAYAGTNFADFLDLQTDLQSVGIGDNQVLADIRTKTFRKSQFQTALEFAKDVEAEIKKINPNAKITTAGHSLGESLAMYVALKQGYSNIGFNGPDIQYLISEEEVSYMKQHPEQFRNYRHKYDVIGNITGNETKTAIYPKIYPKERNLFDTIQYHYLTEWIFNEKGQLVDLDGKIISNPVVASFAETTAKMYRYQKLKNRLSSGGLSSNERIFLDSLQGMMLGDGMENVAKVGAEEIKTIRDEAVSKAQNLWEQIDFSNFQYLSHDEVVTAFAAAGVTYDSVVGAVEREFDQANQKSGALALDFSTLNQQIHQMIDKKISSDQELAGDFKKWIGQM
ncbi:triacylglycerol lipase [Streptococcus gordonii]|uniref:hypothetical protein n=1 Tax=Streptococcus TaxID=1301 RepID=UPI000390630E|nr:MULTISPECIES: hypothetical protein [Streptococcus]EEY80848.2 hypothetical protein HMPREF0847_00068 [Streptococcus sp. 2_1_36FAA]MBZ2124140.1 triacylglycerol lipase [Streptococcus gordonii]MCB6583125.1 triacylglycerol lipase [Streptococcus gordonii]MCB7053855.1 triacylglycerol lipase [Streptococcus gordonii]MCB7055942.1 triacylglycerol lipase [Streptococcus gordonii]